MERRRAHRLRPVMMPRSSAVAAGSVVAHDVVDEAVFGGQDRVVNGVPAYAIDEQTAIKVEDGSVEVVSEGQRTKFGS